MAEPYVPTAADKKDWDMFDWRNRYGLATDRATRQAGTAAHVAGGPQVWYIDPNKTELSGATHDISSWWSNYDQAAGPQSSATIHGVGWLPTNQEVNRSQYLAPQNQNWEYTRWAVAPWESGTNPLEFRNQWNNPYFEQNQPQTYGWGDLQVTTGQAKTYEGGGHHYTDNWGPQYAVELIDFDAYAKDFKFQAALKKLRGVDADSTENLQFQNMSELLDAQKVITGTYQAPQEAQPEPELVAAPAVAPTQPVLLDVGQNTNTGVGGGGTSTTVLTNAATGSGSGLSSAASSITPGGVNTDSSAFHDTASQPVINALSTYNTQIQNLSDELGIANTTISDLQNTIGQNKLNIGGLNTTIGDLNTTIGNQASTISGLEGTIGGLQTSIDTQNTTIGSLNEQIAANAAQQKAAAELAANNQERLRTAAAYGSSGRPLNPQVRGVKTLNELSTARRSWGGTRGAFGRKGLRISSLNI